jgi:long-chain fatty acid transport protein
MNRRSFAAGLALATASFGFAGAGAAQGSSVYTQSACASARAGAAAANPCFDGSAVLYNPAGLALRPGAISAGITGIWTRHTFEYDYTGQSVQRDPSIVPVPQVYATARFGDLGVGLGVFAPYGGSINWPETFEGRFVTYDQTLRAIFVQPTVAYAIVPGALSIGGGATFVRGNIYQDQRADLSEVALPGTPFTFATFGIPRGTDFANVNLQGSGWGTGWHIGVLLQPTDWVSVGARYLHRVTTELEGDAIFEPIPTGLVVAPGSPFAGPPFNAPVGAPVDALVQGAFQTTLADQGVRSSVTWPEQAVLGVHVRPLPALSLLLDYHYFGWSSFDRLPIDFQGEGQDTELVLNYNNAASWRLGAEYGVGEGLRIRGGFIYNTAASPTTGVSPLLPEGERNYLALGLGYRLPMGIQADAFYQYIDQIDRRGRVRSPLPGQNPLDLNIGVYSLDAHLFGITFAMQPGFLNR